MVSSQGSEVTNGDEDPAIIRRRVQTGGGVTADIEWSTGDAGGERVGYSTFDAASLAAWPQANGTVTRTARSPSSDGMSAEHAEIRRLEKELARAQMERDILKKRAKATSLFEDQRERTLCLDLAQGYGRLADQLQLRSKLERMRPSVTQDSSSDRA